MIARKICSTIERNLVSRLLGRAVICEIHYGSGLVWILFFQIHKVCWISFASWGSFIGFYIRGSPISTSLACLSALGVRILGKEPCSKGNDGGWDLILRLTLFILFYGGRIGAYFPKFSVSIKDKNNWLQRRFHWLLITFSFYLLPPTQCNTVLLQYSHCGTKPKF